jgi:hypothetical protein
VFEWLAELLMNTTRDVVAPAMRAAAEDICGPDAERIFTSDTRDLMALFVVLRKLLREVKETPLYFEAKLTSYSVVSTISPSKMSTSLPIHVSSRSSHT